MKPLVSRKNAIAVDNAGERNGYAWCVEGYVARRSFVSVPLVALMIRVVIILVDTIAIHPRRKCNGKGNQRTKQV
jgi:hypothetical protein